MGNSRSKTKDLSDKEYNTKRRFVMGVHLGKAREGIEANVQIGGVSNGFRKFFRIRTKKIPSSINESRSNHITTTTNIKEEEEQPRTQEQPPTLTKTSKPQKKTKQLKTNHLSLKIPYVLTKTSRNVMACKRT